MQQCVENDEEDEDDKEEEKEQFFFAKMLKMTKYNSLPNLVRLAQWEQVSEYTLQPVKIEPDEPVRLRKNCKN